MITSELWILAMGTIVLGFGAVMLLVWDPRALLLALGVGLMAIGVRMAFTRVKTREHAEAEASSAVASTGLVIASIAVAPLIAFAVLWTGVLVLLGAMWVLNAIGLF
jgi:hypothetical protein